MTPYMPYPARIVARRTEAEGIFTFVMRFTDAEVRKASRFVPGQFARLGVRG